MTKKKVLLIDDDKDFRDVMVDILKEEGFQVLSLTKPENIKKYIAKENIHIAVIDYNLGKTNGFKVAKMVKNTDSNNKTSIVIISSQINIKEQAVKKYRYFFEKPINYPQFFKTLRSI